MKALIAGFLAFLAVSAAHASTKYVLCTETDVNGKMLYVNATLDDESDEAEVQNYMAGAPCEKSHTCSTDIYKKTVLPSVIRLTYITFGEISQNVVIDINRSNLDVTTRSTVKLFNDVKNSVSSGKCTLNVDNSKKLL